MNFSRLQKSFRYALRGLYRVFREEQSFRIQLYSTLFVFILMYAFPLRTIERAMLWIVILSVLVLELVNSIFERFADLLRPRLHHGVEEVKDIMAAAVLVASVGSVIVGLIIFWPYLWNFASGSL